jgi:predicted nuclease of predicted toxin-antitoxin system
MKLLLDANLSRRIVPFLQEKFPSTNHVALLGLEQASDREIWEYAKTEGFVIVSKDNDFQDLSVLLGSPPKVVWIRSQNQNRAGTLKLLIDSEGVIRQTLLEQDNELIEIQTIET